jgi:uroporphyrinogen-III synthase
MPGPLDGRVVALAETRQLDELAELLTKEGATTLPVPMVTILDTDDPAPVAVWLRELAADRFTHVVFMTGEGVNRLMNVADAEGLRGAVVAALGRAVTVVRGPKPARVLKELGLTPTRVADAPTTAGLIATLAREDLAGKTVGVQVHGHDNPPLVEAIEAAGATAAVVRPYRYAPAADAERVAGLIARMAAGTVDLLVITSTPQVERLFEVAAGRGTEAELRRGLERTAVAAVGPVAADALTSRGVRVDICPTQGWVMKKLVQVIARELDAKRPRTPAG